MQTHLVQETIKEVKTSCENQNDIDVEQLEFIEKEVDMGFYDQHSFEVKDGIVVNMSCQRISRCSCNCNKCSTMLF